MSPLAPATAFIFFPCSDSLVIGPLYTGLGGTGLYETGLVLSSHGKWWHCEDSEIDTRWLTAGHTEKHEGDYSS